VGYYYDNLNSKIEIIELGLKLLELIKENKSMTPVIHHRIINYSGL
jgi:hypothetical protein